MFFVGLRQRWDLADWERRLESGEEELRRHEARAETVFARDRLVRESPAKAVELVIESPQTAQRSGRDRLTFAARITVHNRWAYPITVDRMTGTFAFQGNVDVELPIYADRFTLDPWSARSIHRDCVWMPIDSLLQSANIGPERFSQRGVTVKSTVYCLTADRREFTVSAQMQLHLFVPPRPT